MCVCVCVCVTRLQFNLFTFEQNSNVLNGDTNATFGDIFLN